MKSSLSAVCVLLVAAALAGSCSPPEPRAAEGRAERPRSASAPGAPLEEAAVEQSALEAPRQSLPQGADGAAPPLADEAPLVIFLGDSLTAGLGVGESEAFPEQLRLRLAAEGIPSRVVNAGISGDTTAGGRARLAWLLRQQPDVLVAGLGANDGLRGMALAETEANLRAIVTGAREAGAQVLLLGMMLPPNYGPDYTAGFREIFPRLAGELEVPLVPFLLTGVAGIPELNQADGIHPTAAGHRLMAGNVLPRLREILQESARR